MPEHSAESVEEFVLNKIRGDQGVSLKGLVRAADQSGFSERDTRSVLRQMERDGAVYADWDWKYHTYNPAEATG